MSILSKSSHSNINSRSSPNSDRIFRPIKQRNNINSCKNNETKQNNGEEDNKNEDEDSEELDELFVKINQLSLLEKCDFRDENIDSNRSTPFESDLWLLPQLSKTKSLNGNNHYEGLNDQKYDIDGKNLLFYF